MAGTPQYADISSFQDVIDWPKYTAWARQWDGMARVAMKATEGVGFTDPQFKANRAGALAAGVDCIIYYHYARPDLNPGDAGAMQESAWFTDTIGRLRAQDLAMLDYEQNTPNATAAWAETWLFRTASANGKRPLIYSYLSFIEAHLQDKALASYPLVYANWQYTPTERPPAPAPWTSYDYLQWTDKATNIPGIAGAVDVNVFLGGNAPVPIPVPTTTQGGENAVFIDNIDQLEPGETEDACVAFSCANVFYSTQPGTQNHYTAEQVDQLADKWYVRETGSITSSAGLDVPQLHTILDGMGLHWEAIPITSNGPANDEAVRVALRAGKLVIVCAAESSFFDLEIGRPPYNWNTQPFNHCIVATGNITSGPYAGNVWVRDTVAVSGGYPPSTKRPYSLAKMQYVSLTAVTPTWLRGDTSMQQYTSQSADFARWFVATDADHWKCIKTGNVVQFGIRNFYSSLSLDGNTLPIAGLPLTGEISLTVNGKSVVLQIFERFGIWYDPVHAKDSQPGTGAYALCHLNDPDFLAHVPGLPTQQPTPTPAPVDISALVTSINAIADGIAPLVAAALVEAKKL